MAEHPVNNEQALIQKVAEGDEAAFRELFDQYWDNIYQVAFALSKSTLVAEDIVQEVFLKVWLKRHELPQVERFDNYLFIIARNHIYSELKKLKLRAYYTNDLHHYFETVHQTPEDQLLFRESAMLIEKAVQRLPEQQQQVYRLVREKGLTHEQAADTLGISHHTVRNHIIRAMRSIREFLQSHASGILLLIALFEAFL